MNFRGWFSDVWSDATRTINVEESHGASGDKLARNLGLISIFLFTVTQAVGSGILTTPGIISQQYAGSHSYLSFLWAGLVCAPAALCLAKMASMTSRSGSTGSYACMVLGQFVGLLMFFDVMLECVGGTASVAVSQADHIKLIIRLAGERCGQNWHLADAWSKTPTDVNWLMLLGTVVFTGLAAWLLTAGRAALRAPIQAGDRTQQRLKTGALLTFGVASAIGTLICAGVFLTTLPSVNLLSVGVVGVVMCVLLMGVTHTKVMTNVLTVVKIILVVTLICIFWHHFSWDLFNRPIPAGMAGTIAGASSAFFAYVGIDMATTAAGETKNAKRNVPLGMMLGLVVVTLLYVAAAFTFNGAVDYTLLPKGDGEAAPMATGLEILGYKDGAIFVALGSTIALFSVVLASAYSTTRLVFGIAQHRLLPAWFEQVTQKRKVPLNATLVVCGVTALLTGLLAVHELMHLTNIGTMTAFITISLTVGVMTIRQTEWRNPKKAFIGAIWVLIAALGVIGAGRLIVELPLTAFIRLLVVWAAVAVLFVCYSRHHSKLHNKPIDVTPPVDPTTPSAPAIPPVDPTPPAGE